VKLHISDSLSLPIDAVTQKFAILGRTGSGKSYAATKLCEEMLDANAQVVALDPVGVWYGLRVGGNFEIPIFGGLHADMPLEPGAGEFIANLIVDRGISAVLDVSQFLSGDQARFAYDFATRFFFRKKSSPSAVHLFVEECQEFVPQNISGGQRGGFETRMLNAFERLIKLGRNFGIGATLISQRPQEVNKKALNQAECMLAFQMTGPQERKAVASWVADKAGSQGVIDLLPKLEVGECQVWSPQWLQVDKKVRIAKKKTADVSSTPKSGGEKRADPKPLSQGELEKFSAQMLETIERAKADDPKELRKRIRDLEKDLAKKDRAGQAVVEKCNTSIKTRDVPVLKDGQISRLEKLHVQFMREFSQQAAHATALVTRLDDLLKPVRDAVQLIDGATKQRDAARQSLALPISRPPAATDAQDQRREAVQPAGGNSNVNLGVGERRCGIAIAQHASVTREQLTVLTGYKRSTRNTYIQRLRSAGLVAEVGDRIAARPELLEWLGPDYEQLPTGTALQEYWLNKLPQGESAVLKVILDSYLGGGASDRETIGEKTSFKRSTRNTYIQRLAARELVKVSGEIIQPSDSLFD
jgi:hypothetical protein